MPKTARTIDIALVLGGADWAVALSKVLDLGITGDASPSNQAYLGRLDEAATVHVVGQTFEIGTIYASDESDAIRTHIDDAVDPWIAVVSPTADLLSFEAARVSLGALPEAAPPDDVITGTLSLPIASRGYYGTGSLSVTPFTLTAGSGSVTIGDLPLGAEVFLLVLEETVAATSIDMVVGAVAAPVPGVSVRKLATFPTAVTGAVVTTTTPLTGDVRIAGYILVGQGQEVGGG